MQNEQRAVPQDNAVKYTELSELLGLLDGNGLACLAPIEWLIERVENIEEGKK